MNYLFPPLIPSVPIADSDSALAVHRVYCVGKNYVDHAREMGGDPSREPPCFFSKPADAVVHGREEIPFPGHTGKLHYEVELVVALGKGGRNVAVDDAADLILGYGVGIDLTRRDLQDDAKKAGRPWDVAKGFDNSAPLSAIHRVARTGILDRAEISLTVNGEIRQQGNIADMTWGVAEIIAELSTYFTLREGDLIFTGTPAGVGPLQVGDRVVATVEGIDQLAIRLV
ncbi:MAG: fumarylacetoacetate hydrolase family protein [Gammaproteobacteria bacterium]